MHLMKSPEDGSADGNAASAFRRLTPAEQNLLIMYIQGGYNYSLMARQMKVTRKCMRDNIVRIKNKIRKNYEQISI